MATLKFAVFWSSQKLMSLRGTGASALPPLTIFHSLFILQRWQHRTQTSHRPRQSRRHCIPAQHRRAGMTHSAALPLPKTKQFFFVSPLLVVLLFIYLHHLSKKICTITLMRDNVHSQPSRKASLLQRMKKIESINWLSAMHRCALGRGGKNGIYIRAGGRVIAARQYCGGMQRRRLCCSRWPI
jgi:hypothetical protein